MSIPVIPILEVAMELTDPCKNNNGGCTHSCKPTADKRVTCTCFKGFKLEADGRTCSGKDLFRSHPYPEILDEDECSSGNHGCVFPATCSNAIGQYTCVCPRGYHLRKDKMSCEGALFGNVFGDYGSLADINECLDNVGNCGYKCVNTDGSFKCACPTGETLGPDLRSCTSKIGSSYFVKNS